MRSANSTARAVKVVQCTFRASGRSSDLVRTFTEYNRWNGLDGKLGSIARGQALFNTRQFATGTSTGSTICRTSATRRPPPPAVHATTSRPRVAIPGQPQRNTGIGGGWRSHRRAGRGQRIMFPASRSPAQPRETGIPGAWADRQQRSWQGADYRQVCRIGKFTVPQLRALAAREPYFHDGTARTLEDVVKFYNQRFAIELDRRGAAGSGELPGHTLTGEGLCD